MTFILRIRSYAHEPWVDLWLIQRDSGGIEQGLMHSQMFPAGVERIIETLGLPVERETCVQPLSDATEQREHYAEKLAKGTHVQGSLIT